MIPSIRTADAGPVARLAADRVRARYTPHRFQGKNLSLGRVHAEALKELSAEFTSDREALPPGYLSQPRRRAAYLLYFLPTGVGTVRTALRLSGGLPAPRNGQENKVLRVLDLGAGPLTATLAVALEAPPDVKLEVTAVDGSAAMLEDGRAILEQLRPGTKLTAIVGNLRDGRTLRQIQGAFDVVMLANVLNEWTVGGTTHRLDPAELVARLLDAHLPDQALALLVEPGTRSGSHHLIAVREHLLALGELHVRAPCMGDQACPLADSTRDWCFSEQPWQRPEEVVELDQAIGHKRATLKFSYLAVTRDPVAAPQPGVWRVIGGPMQSGGQWRRYLCGPQGRVVAKVPLDRLGAALRLQDAWRGDLVALPGKVTTTRGPRGDEAVLELEQRRPQAAEQGQKRPYPPKPARR